MRIIIPVSKSDVHLLPDWVELYKKMGGSPRQTVWLFPTASCLSQATQAAVAIAPYAKICEVIPWSLENIEPWPLAGNNMFIHCVIEIQKRGDTEPWYFCELDNTLTGTMPFDKLENEYILSGCKFMGCVVPSRKILAGTKEMVLDHADTHMVGTGIYPANIMAATDGQYKFARMPDSWDIVIRNYVRRSCHHTKLIDHHWSTVNYREENGQIVCDNGPGNPFGTDHSGVVSKEAVIVHGCKDGSLMKLMLARMGNAPAPIELAKEDKKPVLPGMPIAPAGPAVKYDKGVWKDFQRREHELAAKNTTTVVVQVPAAMPPPVIVQPESPFPELETDEEVTEPEIVDDGKSPVEKVLAVLHASPKAVRAKDIYKKTRIDLATLREMAKDESSPFEINKVGLVKAKSLELVS